MYQWQEYYELTTIRKTKSISQVESDEFLPNPDSQVGC